MPYWCSAFGCTNMNPSVRILMALRRSSLSTSFQHMRKQDKNGLPSTSAKNWSAGVMLPYAVNISQTNVLFPDWCAEDYISQCRAINIQRIGQVPTCSASDCAKFVRFYHYLRCTVSKFCPLSGNHAVLGTRNIYAPLWKRSSRRLPLPTA